MVCEWVLSIVLVCFDLWAFTGQLHLDTYRLLDMATFYNIESVVCVEESWTVLLVVKSK